jgi:predicted dithiol-disulfide oxidoreductase (DUF899 family)
LKAEKEFTWRGGEPARLQQEPPWVPINQEYRFETGEGSASLAYLFGAYSLLLVYHFTGHPAG